MGSTPSVRLLSPTATTLLAAGTELTAQLQHHAKVTEAMMRTMEHGDSLVDTLRSNDSAQIRPALSNSVRAFERARHRRASELIAVAMAEGRDRSGHPGTLEHQPRDRHPGEAGARRLTRFGGPYRPHLTSPRSGERHPPVEPMR